MLCSVCLSFGDPENGINIFNEMGMNLNIAKIIEQHMWIKPQPNDDSLSYICHPCWKAIVEFHDFYEQARMAHDNHQLHKEAVIIKEELLDSAIDVKLEREEEQDAEQFKVHNNHQFPMETFIIKEEVLDSAMDIEAEREEEQHAEQFKAYDNHQLHNEAVIIKEEFLDSTDSINLEREEEQPAEQFKVKMNHVSKATNEIAKNGHNSARSSEWGKQSKELERENDSFPQQSFELLEPMEQINCSDDENESENDIVSDAYESSATGDMNDCNSEAKLATVKRKHKTNAQKSENTQNPKKKKAVYEHDPRYTEEMIQKHIPMACSLCVFVDKTFFGIRKHFASCHPNVKPYILCCDRKLTKPCFVAQHALTHEDPNCFKCLECNKSFTTTFGLTSHNLKYHAPEEAKIYSCNLCPKKFAKSHFLELHNTSHIPKDQWQYFCTECEPQRPFASEHLMNIHKNMRHKRRNNICHICAKVIRDKYSFEKHLRLHFEDSGPRIPCPRPDCKSWLKDEDSLRQHMSRHNLKGIKYKCTECDKIFKNRPALTNHKLYTHSTEIFTCKECGKTFKKAISLREHMTQHTDKPLYKCPFCNKTFNSSANMYSHKKRKHPVEWDEWRRDNKDRTHLHKI